MALSGDEWFSGDLAKGLSRLYNNSHVEAFVDAEAYYADLRREVEATERGSQICWIGFEGHADTPMPASASGTALKPFPPRAPNVGQDKTWLQLLTEASGRGVALRVLLNLHPKPDSDPSQPKKYKQANFDLVERLNRLANCLAINDFRYLWVNGTHHQKLVVVYGPRGLIAYVGTCDVELSRIVYRWCEVQCRVMGDAAAELYGVFQRRWSEHTAVFKRPDSSQNANLKPVAELRLNTPPAGNFLMQTATTYGNPGRLNPFVTYITDGPPRQVVNQPHGVRIHTDAGLFNLGLLVGGVPALIGNDFFTEKDLAAPPLIVEGARQAATYAFAPTGHTGIYQALRQAIETTKEFIYIEDQYLVNDGPMGGLEPMMNLLVRKLRQSSFKKLIVFCTRIDDINEEFLGTGWKHRSRFVQALLDAAFDKVVVCQYKSRGALGHNFGKPHEGAFYIHSKTWIFDDAFLITGSANCNRRGYSHDSELDLALYDQNKRFVRELRIRLWQSRLNTQGIRGNPLLEAQLADFLVAARFWETPAKFGLTIESNREVSLEPKRFPDLDLDSYKARVTLDPQWQVPVRAWLDHVKMTGLWDYVVDPDGT